MSSQATSRSWASSSVARASKVARRVQGMTYLPPSPSPSGEVPAQSRLTAPSLAEERAISRVPDPNQLPTPKGGLGGTYSVGQRSQLKIHS